MPKLSILTVCEKVIFDQDGPASVISIFEKMIYRLQDAPLPERAAVPNAWAIFTQWEHEPDELGKEFTQVAVVTAPDGSMFSRGEVSFMQTDSGRRISRARVNLQAIPVWLEGRVNVEIFLSGNDVPVGSTGFNIRYVPKEENVQQTPTT